MTQSMQYLTEFMVWTCMLMISEIVDAHHLAVPEIDQNVESAEPMRLSEISYGITTWSQGDK